MCGQRLSTAWTLSPSAIRHTVCPLRPTTSLPFSRTSGSEAALTNWLTSLTAMGLLPSMG